MDALRESCWMLAMLRLLLLLTLIIGMGCRTRPFSMRGIMDVNGAMKMDGKMDVAGDMKMSGNMNTSMKTDNTASRLSSVVIQSGKNSSCEPIGKLAIIDVDGILINKNISGLGSMNENPVALFREKLDALRLDPMVRAVVLRINSPGGGVTAADIMSRDVISFRQETQIPVVACLMDVGAGGAYYLASHTDAIIAHPTSIVGGIGVILNVYNLEDTLGQFNIASEPIKAGDQIDIASTERAMEKGERATLQKIADSFHSRFIDHVKSVRPNSAGVKENFGGGIFTGADALKNGLIDDVGYLDDAIALARIKSNLGTDSSVVMLRRDNDRAYSQFDVTPNTPYSLLPIKMPGLDRSTLPTFLYLWQADPSYLTSAGG